MLPLVLYHLVLLLLLHLWLHLPKAEKARYQVFLKMQLDVEVSPPAFEMAQPELECTCSVLGMNMQCRLNVGCIGYMHMSQ